MISISIKRAIANINEIFMIIIIISFSKWPPFRCTTNIDSISKQCTWLDPI